jgi:hypothetical protein
MGKPSNQESTGCGCLTLCVVGLAAIYFIAPDAIREAFSGDTGLIGLVKDAKDHVGAIALVLLGVVLFGVLLVKICGVDLSGDLFDPSTWKKTAPEQVKHQQVRSEESLPTASGVDPDSARQHRAESAASLSPHGSGMEQLSMLTKLRDSGALTEEEFARAKARLKAEETAE